MVDAVALVRMIWNDWSLGILDQSIHMTPDIFFNTAPSPLPPSIPALTAHIGHHTATKAIHTQGIHAPDTEPGKSHLRGLLYSPTVLTDCTHLSHRHHASLRRTSCASWALEGDMSFAGAVVAQASVARLPLFEYSRYSRFADHQTCC